MALVTCPECGGNVSSFAASCPHCGYPLVKNMDAKKITLTETEPEKQFELGIKYSKGEGVERDATKAAYWWEKAAEQGHNRAQYSLAVCYIYGNGVNKDILKAIKWLKKSASQKNTEAFELLQCMILD